MIRTWVDARVMCLLGIGVEGPAGSSKYCKTSLDEEGS